MTNRHVTLINYLLCAVIHAEPVVPLKLVLCIQMVMGGKPVIWAKNKDVMLCFLSVAFTIKITKGPEHLLKMLQVKQFVLSH